MDNGNGELVIFTEFILAHKWSFNMRANVPKSIEHLGWPTPKIDINFRTEQTLEQKSKICAFCLDTYICIAGKEHILFPSDALF